MFAVFYFVALYFAIVKEFESDEAGVGLLFYTPGLGGKFALTASLLHQLIANQAEL